MGEPVCPFCAQPLAAGVVNKDHIFNAALGGRQTVPAHERCNSPLGSEVEGQLLRPGSYLNLLRQARGTGHPLPAEFGSGHTEIQVDTQTGEASFRKPVERVAEENGPVIEVSGSHDQVAALLKGQKLTPDQRASLLSDATQHQISDSLTSRIIIDLTLLGRFIAKVAVAALAFVDPSESVATDLASQLRDYSPGLHHHCGHPQGLRPCWPRSTCRTRAWRLIAG
jgi:HNH endonuclease